MESFFEKIFDKLIGTVLPELLISVAFLGVIGLPFLLWMPQRASSEQLQLIDAWVRDGDLTSDDLRPFLEDGKLTDHDYWHLSRLRDRKQCDAITKRLREQAEIPGGQ